MAKKDDLAEELEEFETELFADDDGDTLVEDPERDLKESDSKDPDETGQEAETVTEEEPVKAEETVDDPKPDDPEPNLTTLPDDPEVFGELAGKQVTAQQLIDGGYLGKLVTWGHQGRHLIKKGQDDIEAAKAETSEAQKLRELLEKRFDKEDDDAIKAPAPTEEEFAGQLLETYMPGLKRVAEQGGIEADFIKEFPKATSQIEHRFQSGSDLIQALIKEVSELREFVGKQKESNAETLQAEANTAASGHFDGLLTDLSTKGDLYTKLGENETKDDFVKWLSSEESGLRIAEKDVKTITEGDVHSAWLLYAHQHPEKFTQKAKKNAEDARLASGGGGQSTATTRKPKPDDELGNFEADLKESMNQIEY